MADPTVLEEVRAVFRRNRSEIIARFRAHGAGVGREGETYAIVVYLDSEDDRPTRQVEIESVPLKFEVTGRFKTLAKTPK